MNSVILKNLLGKGQLSYAEGLLLQRSIHQAISEGEATDTILFLEHSPVITLGTRGQANDILASESRLAELGVEVSPTDRGGQVTFHGPGQLVVYFLVDMKHALRQIRAFVEGIEGAIIDYLSETQGLVAHLENENPGIWLPEGKIAAVGISVKNRISMHGIAFNVSVPMDYFNLIIPCGIKNRPPISLGQITKNPPSLNEVALAIAPFFARRLGYDSFVWS